MDETNANLNKHIQLVEEYEHKLKAFERFKQANVLDSIPQPGKLDQLKEYLLGIKKNIKKQCIVFTDHDFVYSLLRPFLKTNEIAYIDLDGGNIKDMDKTVGAYKRGECQVLLADSSMYSCGMNLENTSDICFIHSMGELKEKQVIGRAHRYGRNGPLTISYFLYRG